MIRPEPSTAGIPIFRELSGPEAAEIFAHDLEQAIIDLLATGEFKQKALDLFEKSGKFGAGAAHPVVVMIANMRIKVYTSVEAARSKEKMPPPQSHSLVIETGKHGPDSEEVITSDVQISRIIGTDTSNAVDRARKEVGITPKVPKKDNNGIVLNSTDEHEARAADYKDRMAKTHSKAAETRAAKKAEREKLANNEQAPKEA